MNLKKHKHLTLTERITIQSSLNQNKSIRKIAKELRRDVTTIAKEIKRHLVIRETGRGGRKYNPCSKVDTCKIQNLCNPRPCFKFWCKECGKCFLYCKEFEEKVCERLLKAPYCCNGCPKKSTCIHRKKYYYAEHAHSQYRSKMSDSRKGILLSEEETVNLERLITTPIICGQSIHHVCSVYKDEIPVCEKTIYNYIENSVFELKNIDLVRKVRYKARKRPVEHKIDTRCRENRTYQEYLTYIQENDVPTVQMDTVKGGKTGKVLLTLLFVQCGFMLAYLRDNNTSLSVVSVFNLLYEKLGEENFKRLFPVILTDNGTEFSNPLRIETNCWGEIRTRVFYCDINRSDQKGSIEVNHEFIRRILPKGKTFEKLTQEQVNLMMSHINSYRRKKFNDVSPYTLFKTVYGQELLDLLDIDEIAPNEINLTPNLLKN